MTDFESLPDIPEPAEEPAESNLSGSVDFDDAPFPTQEEMTTLHENGSKANQWAWIIAIVVALLILCLCCFGLLAITLIATQGNHQYLSGTLNEILAYAPLSTGF